jgi:hypothetical protein
MCETASFSLYVPASYLNWFGEILLPRLSRMYRLAHMDELPIAADISNITNPPIMVSMKMCSISIIIGLITIKN